MFLKMNWEKNYIDAFVSSIPILTKKQETEILIEKVSIGVCTVICTASLDRATAFRKTDFSQI